MVNHSDQMHSIPTSPSHGCIAAYQGYSLKRAYRAKPRRSRIDAKLSRLCEQEKVVHALEEKLQQLHKEKYTLEQALLSASQEIKMHAEEPEAIQTLVAAAGRPKDDNVKELDAVGREKDVKPNCDTPAGEIVRLKEAEPQNTDYSQEFKRTDSVFYETISTPKPNGVYSEEVTDKESNNEKMPKDITYSPEGEMQTPNSKPEGCREEDMKDSIHKEEETVTSQESTPEISRENQTRAGKSLPLPPEPAPLPSAQPQLLEGSHFMCV
ncbi:Pleckstrin-like protein domain-containing family A member 5 [Heterocephalus glaber]|uniref:Pleckstrin-like protein domain-containing family A member 5 n=1 Tax=Heterocephalus glaber TaxID=10181 RepID=G5B7Y3_HETGA|nr:Pleckstrin-like protein domain-containing family A member 5 [Heterocephalus glaber]